VAQRAEVIDGATDHCLVTYEGRSDRINEAHIDRIVEAT